ncbi:MAG: pyridoxal-5'-phosphate-dependent protein subunit beta, partial [Gammaproteobacteria bacterium]|nr:pyridoxal-5'-phosphate-dependent protein subunit beta [Gammaproteobacteria bacterium]
MTHEVNKLAESVVDEEVLGRTIERFRELNIRLPKLSDLADPATIDDALCRELAQVDPDKAHPLNLFRVHWFNDSERKGRAELPGYLSLPSELTGVDANVIVVLGDRFPMIHAHKVLAAYSCLVPRLITGQFDPTRHRAIWPSTGNYCRGGVAISRILGCRGVAVLPEGMSRERFEWLEQWVSDPGDIIRTPGTESNVKEIYDACARLARDADNVILNQFNEFGNYVAHRTITGPALERVFSAVGGERGLHLRGFVSASGSAGTLAAGDHLKERLGAAVCAVEAVECPTLLYNGFGEHNIQGIGDKHVPYIHNVMNTDFVAGVSDQATDRVALLFNSDAGRAYLRERKGVDGELIDRLRHLGLSSIANVIGAIKLAKYLKLGSQDALITVATDGAAMYGTEFRITEHEQYADSFDAIAAAEVFGQHLLGAATDNLLELTLRERERIFNLGYYTWVEQQ